MSIRSLVKQVLAKQQDRKYEKQLAWKQVTYDAWIRKRETDLGINREFHAADELCQMVCLVFSEGRMAERTLEICGQYFGEHPECLMVYGDEDVCVLNDSVLEAHVSDAGTWDGCARDARQAAPGKAGRPPRQAAPGKAGRPPRRTSPWFKPAWSPDLLDSYFYFGSIAVLRADFYGQAVSKLGSIPGAESGEESDAGRKIRYLKCSEEAFAWLRQCAALAGGYQKGAKSIGHISEILFHGGSKQAQEAFLNLRTVKAEPPGEDSLSIIASPGSIPSRDDSLSVIAPPGSIPSRDNLLSIIIPSRDNPGILEKCIRAVINNLQGMNAVPGGKYAGTAEIIVVDNGSSGENRRRIEEMAGELDFIYLYRPMEFHFSKMCNLGAGQAKGDLLLFLNDDVELACGETLKTLAGLAAREYTGAVGIKLYYPGSDRIQHAGITNLPMGPVHKMQFLPDNISYYYGSNRGRRNVLAVTAACLMVEKRKFDEAGGFPEKLRVAFNDVGLCFALYEKGYHNVCVNDLFAYHHESLSRGDDESPEKLQRLLGERDALYAAHSELDGKDPYYPMGLGREGLDTRIRPAYETAGNRLQEPGINGINGIKNGIKKGTGKGTEWKELSLAEYRHDSCVLIRVEQNLGGIVCGYGVVLGDDNACYEKKLLLISAQCLAQGSPERTAPPAHGIIAQDSPERTAPPAHGIIAQGSPERTAPPAHGSLAQGSLARVSLVQAQQPAQGSPEMGSAVKKEGGNPSGAMPGMAWALEIEGQYRPDLVENMPDQQNVGLSGFWVRIDAQNAQAACLPPGEYYMGMAVQNRVTGLKLWNAGSRLISVPPQAAWLEG